MRCVWGAAPLKSWSVGTLFGARVSHGRLGCIWRVHLSRFHQINFWGNWDWGIYKILQLSLHLHPEQREERLPSFQFFFVCEGSIRSPASQTVVTRQPLTAVPAQLRRDLQGRIGPRPASGLAAARERGTQRHKGGISRPRREFTTLDLTSSDEATCPFSSSLDYSSTPHPFDFPAISSPEAAYAPSSNRTFVIY